MVKSSTVSATAALVVTTLTIDVYPGAGPPIPQSVTGYLKVAGVGLKDKSVALYMVKGGVETLYGSATTYTDGSWGLYSVPVDVGTYAFNAVFTGDATYAGSNASKTCVFAKVATALSIAISPASGLVPLTVTVSGKLTRVDTGAGLGGRDYKIYKDGVFKLAGTTSIDPVTLGQYAFADTLTAAGTFSYYVEYLGEAGFMGCEVLPCPNCGRSLTVGEVAGERVSCDVCGAISEVVANG